MISFEIENEDDCKLTIKVYANKFTSVKYSSIFYTKHGQNPMCLQKKFACEDYPQHTCEAKLQKNNIQIIVCMHYSHA